MSKIAYWGIGGQFGPFDMQDDGWPNAGQVMRYFREKLSITAKAFGKMYGEEIREDGKFISERWILESACCHWRADAQPCEPIHILARHRTTGERSR